jgi:alpha/beta superfamily hydrolase
MKLPNTRVLRIDVPDTAIELEARLTDGSGQDGLVVIAPPHPLYGGTIESPVVAALEEAFQERGLGTLAFNFRGTGQSSGQQRGDVEEALADYLAAACALTGPPLFALAGYSFGSCVALHAASLLGVPQVVLVAPALALLEPELVRNFRGRIAVAIGNQDVYTPEPALRELLGQARIATLEILDGVDHFFSGDQLERLKPVLARLIG